MKKNSLSPNHWNIPDTFSFGPRDESKTVNRIFYIKIYPYLFLTPKKVYSIPSSRLLKISPAAAVVVGIFDFEEKKKKPQGGR